MTTMNANTTVEAELARLRKAFDSNLRIGLELADPLTLDDAETLTDSAAARFRSGGKLDVARQITYANEQIRAAKSAPDSHAAPAFAYAAAVYAEQAYSVLDTYR